MKNVPYLIFQFEARGTPPIAKASLLAQCETLRLDASTIDMLQADRACRTLSDAIDNAPAGCEVHVTAWGHHNYGSVTNRSRFELAQTNFSAFLAEPV